ncbi:MAG: 16S rRNA (adenine(1518)-N(6)/adenine(1519)-N(6))-dimethyltransferase, partial [Anaerolineae bacterium]|nr:16S rRNA (adenine(1518)-N(6)/adenine(1519)-N(6))-dimethyltransferase [Anaerolineae bacterium]
MSHRPRKRFGQNFLHDQGVIERILAHVNPQPGQHLVEIGPGQGALTRGLLQRAGELDAIELDRDLLEPLRRRCAPLGTLHLHNADALKFDFRSLVNDERRLRLVGN